MSRKLSCILNMLSPYNSLLLVKLLRFNSGFRTSDLKENYTRRGRENIHLYIKVKVLTKTVTKVTVFGLSREEGS